MRDRHRQAYSYRAGYPDPLEHGPPAPPLPAERVIRDPEDVYLAICLIVRDQNQDLREWIRYHQHVGVGKFYIFDDNSLLSSQPAADYLQDLIQEGEKTAAAHPHCLCSMSTSRYPAQ